VYKASLAVTLTTNSYCSAEIPSGSAAPLLYQACRLSSLSGSPSLPEGSENTVMGGGGGCGCGVR
jgi:hypothetical protein